MGADDMERLRQWVQQARGVSLQHHLRARYSESMLTRVDCWVVTSRLEADLRRCLGAYAAACAAADPSTRARVSSLRAAARQVRATHTQMSSASANCSAYFPPEAAKGILGRAKEHLSFSRLGLSQRDCCSPAAAGNAGGKRAYQSELANALATVRASEAAEPDAAFRAGVCGRVSRGEGDCASGWQGSWAFSETEVAQTGGAARACAERCRGCPRCRVYSYSAEWLDCSWFHACSLDRLDKRTDGFRTRKLTIAQASEAPGWVSLRATRNRSTTGSGGGPDSTSDTGGGGAVEVRALRADVHGLRSELAAMREEMRHFFTTAVGAASPSR
jgi:hypothetical protein